MKKPVKDLVLCLAMILKSRLMIAYHLKSKER